MAALAVLVPLPQVCTLAWPPLAPGLTAALEPPGLLALNDGAQTQAVAVAAHVVDGVALGLLLGAN